MKRETLFDGLFFLLVLILVCVMLYSGLRIVESTVFHQGQAPESSQALKTITRDGVDYFPRQDITTVLLIGIDQYGPVKASGSYTNRGAADLDILLIFDEREQCCNILHLNRDSMVTMPVLGLGGREAGTNFGQLALSHTYGTGLEDSCENTRKTISNLLYGVEIDYYVAMNMDVIPLMNDAVGGVTVNVTEDFSQVDPSITMGKMHLMGEQAITFVRSRKGVGNQQNASRIERQKEYMKGFLDAFEAHQEENLSFMMETYQQIEPYIVTDCSANAVSGLMDRYADYPINEVLTPEGESVRGEMYMEFYLDEEKLDELILRLFYEPKQ